MDCYGVTIKTKQQMTFVFKVKTVKNILDFAVNIVVVVLFQLDREIMRDSRTLTSALLALCLVVATSAQVESIDEAPSNGTQRFQKEGKGK
jgi:hypothetical protein